MEEYLAVSEYCTSVSRHRNLIHMHTHTSHTHNHISLHTLHFTMHHTDTNLSIVMVFAEGGSSATLDAVAPEKYSS